MTVVGAPELEAALEFLRAVPKDSGTLSMIVTRPVEGERSLLSSGVLDLAVGLVGDTWKDRPSTSSADGGPHPEKQITVMNVRMAAVLAGEDRERQALAGDQLYVDFDIGEENLPAGSLLRIGSAVLKISEWPHTGCAKFRARFGADALRFVNSPEGRSLRLRGLNAWVVEPGPIAVGDPVTPLRA